MYKTNKRRFLRLGLSPVIIGAAAFCMFVNAYGLLAAGTNAPQTNTIVSLSQIAVVKTTAPSSPTPTPAPPKGQCGANDQNPYTPSIDIGCVGKGNPIADAMFAIIRILSNGVGLVIIASIIVAGIQYSASRDDPQSTATAVKRLRSTMIALLIYIFGYAILNYLIPQGFLG